jgi:hypothetical protein
MDNIFRPQRVNVGKVMREIRKTVAALHDGDLCLNVGSGGARRYSPSFVRGRGPSCSESRAYTVQSLCEYFGDPAAHTTVSAVVNLLELVEQGICTEETILAMAEGGLSLSALRLLVHSLRRADQERKFGKR